MINFSFSLSNPFIKEGFDTVWNFGRQLTTHKFLEVETYRHRHILIEFNVAITFRTDHAGIVVGVGLFGYVAHFTIYDHRHWDEENNNWKNT